LVTQGANVHSKDNVSNYLFIRDFIWIWLDIVFYYIHMRIYNGINSYGINSCTSCMSIWQN
jgi:hypothetical protein